MDRFSPIRNFINSLGLAWWARVQTCEPNATYWFGPFLTKRSLRNNLSGFVEELSGECTGSVSYSSIRCRKAEPLTF